MFLLSVLLALPLFSHGVIGLLVQVCSELYALMHNVPCAGPKGRRHKKAGPQISSGFLTS